MICERCNKKKAAVIYRENINGRIKALRLCGECTEILEQAGELEDVSAAVAGIPFPIAPDEEGSAPLPFLGFSRDSAEGGVRCPRCDALAQDVISTGRMGCAVCYTVFGRELSDVLCATHGGGEHRGRISAGFRARLRKAERLAEMKKQLKEAVASENYESAAGLRDAIRALEAEA
jgi:protein arginine kinase activator